MQVLSFDEVMGIHQTLAEDFAKSDDPISPAGVRGDGALLYSAISRQHVGLGDRLKYPTPTENAATLCYGVCSNHAFYNGNKRTALVSLLCHLDKNNLTLTEDVGHPELYGLMLKIAKHELVRHKSRRHDPDAEVEELARWLSRRTRKLKNGERVITFRQLRQILRQFDIFLENPNGNYIDVIKYENIRRGFIIKRTERVSRRICNIPYPKDGAVVGKKLLKSVREACGLTADHGYDSEMFYSAETNVDAYINRYKRTLRALAKT